MLSQGKDRFVTLSLKLRNMDYYVGFSGSESEVGLAVNQLRALVQNVVVSVGTKPNYFERKNIAVSLDRNELVKRVKTEVLMSLIHKQDSNMVLVCSPGRLNEYFWTCVKNMME